MSQAALKPQSLVITGNEAAAWAAFLVRSQVVAAYPITPQTSIIETMASLASSEPDRCRFINVESEHSAMAACIAAAAAGARTFTATSSQGLLLMHELLHWASGARLPIVLVNVNRAPAPGWNIWTDQNDSLSQRDTGWVQFYCESVQEVIDTVIQAYKLSEDLLVPSMVVLDAFFLSHTAEPIQMPDQEIIDRFVPLPGPAGVLDVESPAAFGGLLGIDHYQETRERLHERLNAAVSRIAEIESEWQSLTGRSYGVIDDYRCKDAEIVLVTLATASSTARIVVDTFRDRGIPLGRMKLRLFRPFPDELLCHHLRGKKKVVVLDRNCSYGNGGIVFSELKSALYGLPGSERPEVYGFISGLGGRDLTPARITSMVEMAIENRPPAQSIWIR
ncbi:MAG: pyruvate ferredoxin oxidoreductase [Acidobacteria bacterium]|nr:pyruvate ferredoxin oxidoreductase [Acidobacteriota bacterium]